MATNNYMPMGRNPRSGGAGQAASYKRGGATTKIAGVMQKGGAPKYQKKSIVKTNITAVRDNTSTPTGAKPTGPSTPSMSIVMDNLYRKVDRADVAAKAKKEAEAKNKAAKDAQVIKSIRQAENRRKEAQRAKQKSGGSTKSKKR